MDAAVSNDNADLRPPALLRGTAKGLEIHVIGTAPLEDILAAVSKRLDEAPAFFRGSDVRIKVDDGPMPAGCLARLDELATKFELRIVEVGPAAKKPLALVEDAVPTLAPQLAVGSAPSPLMDVEPPPLEEPEPYEAFEEIATNQAANPLAMLPPPLPDATELGEPVMLADSELTELVEILRAEQPAFAAEEPTQIGLETPALALAAGPELPLEPSPGTRLVVGPVRSGVILEHHGNLIIFGDVNPGAEVRCTGNIVVLGRLRGTAHAGIGQDVGFILALRREPQQIRIGRKVARAADSDKPLDDSEIAYLSSSGAGDQIVVERYTGKLPRNLATSI
jgi:septum formation inhibitor MinC